MKKEDEGVGAPAGTDHINTNTVNYIKCFYKIDGRLDDVSTVSTEFGTVE